MTVYAWMAVSGVVSAVFAWNISTFWGRNKRYWEAYRDGWQDCVYTIELKNKWPMSNPDKRQRVLPYNLFKRDSDAGQLD